MKKISTLLFVLSVGLGSILWAGVPNQIVYQGRLSKTGVPVGGSHVFNVRIYPNANPSVGLWHSGNMALDLPATGEFSLVLNITTEIDWLNAAPRLEIMVDGEKLSPDGSFGANPYALAAKTVDAEGVGTAAIQAGAVTDVKISSVSASKVMLPGTSSPITVWQSTVGGQLDKIDASMIYGVIPTVPSTHAETHLAGGSDPIINIAPTQVLGTALVRNTGSTQVIQATTTVPALDIKGNPGSGSKVLRIFDSGILGQATSVPQEQAHFDAEGNFSSQKSISASSASFAGTLSAGQVNAASGVTAPAISANDVTVANGITAGWLAAPYPIMFVVDEKASGTSGGTFTAGSWVTRTLNKEWTNTIPGASLNSNTVTLPPGTYSIYWRAPAHRVNRHKTVWVKSPSGTTVVVGSSAHAHESYIVTNDSIGYGVFSIPEETDFQLRHYCLVGMTTHGFGVESSAGVPEVYSQVVIQKIR